MIRLISPSGSVAVVDAVTAEYVGWEPLDGELPDPPAQEPTPEPEEEPKPRGRARTRTAKDGW